MEQLLGDEPAPGTIEAGLQGAGNADVLAVLAEHLAGPAPVRDAASVILDVVAARPGGPEALLTTARRLPAESAGRILMLALATEHPRCVLTPQERDEALLGPMRMLAREASVSATAALGLAEKWGSLQPVQRDALLAWFEAAAEGTPDALVLAACVLDQENDAARTHRLLKLVVSSGHVDARRVLERLAASSHRERSLAARRAVLGMGAWPVPDGPDADGDGQLVPRSTVAMLTGVDGLGRFETVLAVPRFAAIWELVVLRIDVDDGGPVSAAATPIADREDVDGFAQLAAEEGVLVAHVGPGEASEIVLRAVTRLPEDRAGRDLAMSAAARVASGMTRRSILPPTIGSTAEGLAEHPAFARAGLTLRGPARAELSRELETILARAQGNPRKLDVLVEELAKTLATRFDDERMRAAVATRARHQATILRALGDPETAGRAAFVAQTASQTALADSPVALRMITNGILAEVRRAEEDPDEGAFRRALRDRFFALRGPAALSDLEALDLLEVVAETIGDRGVDLPDEAVSSMRVLAEEIHDAVRASGPYRRLPMVGARAPVLSEQLLVDIAGRVLARTLPQLPAPVVPEAAAELGAFLGEVCLSRCPQRCFEEPASDLDALFRSDVHPSTLPRQRS